MRRLRESEQIILFIITASEPSKFPVISLPCHRPASADEFQPCASQKVADISQAKKGDIVIETVHYNEKDIRYGKSKPHFSGFVKRPVDLSDSSYESRLSSERTGQIKFGQKVNRKNWLCRGDHEN
jgi:hypothetical protein